MKPILAATKAHRIIESPIRARGSSLTDAKLAFANALKKSDPFRLAWYRVRHLESWHDRRASLFTLNEKLTGVLQSPSRGVGGVGYWIDQIAEVALGTSTAKTKLGGTQVAGTSADYLLPTAARAVIAWRPKQITTTPTANQAYVATLKIESGDLGVKDFEVFAPSVDSGLGTTETQLVQEPRWYPQNQSCNGGEKVQAFGTPQVANTAQPELAADVLLSDTPPAMPVCQAKVAGINYGGGPTATGTGAASSATDGGVTIAGPWRLIKALYGIVVGTTPAASKPVSGQLSANASEFAINPQRWNAAPLEGFLGTTTSNQIAYLSEVEGLNLLLRAPSTPKGTFVLDTAISTAGNFEVGYFYTDQTA